MRLDSEHLFSRRSIFRWIVVIILWVLRLFPSHFHHCEPLHVSTCFYRSAFRLCFYFHFVLNMNLHNKFISGYFKLKHFTSSDPSLLMKWIPISRHAHCTLHMDIGMNMLHLLWKFWFCLQFQIALVKQQYSYTFCKSVGHSVSSNPITIRSRICFCSFFSFFLLDYVHISKLNKGQC